MTDLSDDALEALGLDEDEAIVEIVGEEQARRYMWALRSRTRQYARERSAWEADLERIQVAMETSLAPLQMSIDELTEQLENWHRAVFEDAVARGVADGKLPKTIKINGVGKISTTAPRQTVKIHDQRAICDWAIENGHTDIVKEVWTTTVTQIKELFTDGKPVTADGELLPGVEVTPTPRNYIVKLDKTEEETD